MPNRALLIGLDLSDAAERSCVILSYSHHEMVIEIPPGEGVSNKFAVNVFGQLSPFWSFSYNPPVITELLNLAGEPLVFGHCCG